MQPPNINNNSLFIGYKDLYSMLHIVIMKLTFAFYLSFLSIGVCKTSDNPKGYCNASELCSLFSILSVKLQWIEI